MLSTSMWQAAFPGSTSSTLLLMWREKVTLSSKYCASRVNWSLSRFPTVSSMISPPEFSAGQPLIYRSAGDIDHLSVHEGGHVLGPSRAANGDALYALGDEVVEIHAEPGRRVAGHLRLHKAWGHSVHGDAVAAKLDGQRLGEALDPRLRRGVVGLAAVAERARR